MTFDQDGVYTSVGHIFHYLSSACVKDYICLDPLFTEIVIVHVLLSQSPVRMVTANVLHLQLPLTFLVETFGS